MNYLIIGADGYIGSYLAGRFKEDGKSVFGTTRKIDKVNDYFLFDIRTESVLPVIDQIKGKTAAVICAAESNINRCFVNYEDAYEINVTGTKRLVQALAEHGIYTIFLSTDNVFDGESGGYTEDCSVHPLNMYGKMKVEVEDYLMQYVPTACIFRLAKVVGITADAKNIFTDWAERAGLGEIPCIKGNYMSCVYIEDIYQACKIAIRAKLHGIYHLAEDIAYERSQLAKKFVAALGQDEKIVKEYAVEHFRFKERRPLDVSLKNDKFRKETGYQFTKMYDVISKYIDTNQLSASQPANCGGVKDATEKAMLCIT